MSGGKPGNRGGLGRPSNELRQRLREGLSERVSVLERIADDEKASDRDRLKAIDLLGKYGLGTVKEVTVQHVRERLRLTLDLLREELDPDHAERVIARLRGVWT